MAKSDSVDSEKAESGGDCEVEIESAIPLIEDKDEGWVVHSRRTRQLTEKFHDCGVLCLMLVSVGLCFVFYMVCPRCLFGILLFSACLCPFFHPMNAPLWLAIVLLTVSGWSFTTGALSVTWNNGFK
jgi:hypothetical protein